MSGAVLTISKEDDLGLALASGVALPPVIARAGKRAAERLIEFFTAHIRNAHTRRAYGRVAWNFFAWIDERDVALEGITAVHVAAVVSCPQSAKAAIPTGFSCGSSTFCHGSIPSILRNDPMAFVTCRYIGRPISAH